MNESTIIESGTTELIQHNLEVAKPNFIFFIENIKEPLSKWIQYKGVHKDGNHLLFRFKSSQNSLEFSIYAGVNTGNTYEALNSKSDYIYGYFKEIKKSKLKIL